MTEISCRAFSYFLAAERAGIDLTPLLDGLQVSRQVLEDPRNRVSWEVWAELCERLADELGTDEAVEESAKLVLSDREPTGFGGYFSSILGVFVDAADVYDAAFRFVGPSIYRSMEFSFRRLPDGRLDGRISLKPGFRPSIAWFRMAKGAMNIVPLFVGLPEASVETRALSGRHAHFLITPPRKARGSWFRRVASILRSPRAMTDELAFQHEQLTRTLDSLQRAEGGFRSAMDALPAFVLVHERGRIVYANPALERAMGKATKGRKLEELVHPEDTGAIEDLLSPEASLVPLRLLAASGTLHIEATSLPNFDFAGREAGGVFAVDVTRRWRTEETNRILAESLPDLVARLDGEGTLLDVMAGTSIPSADMMPAFRGMRVWDMIGAVPNVMREQIEHAMRAVRDALASGEERLFELEGTLNGTLRVYELRVVPRSDGDEVLILVRDVSQLREADRRLALADRMVSMGTLSAGIAHEINNPLAYVTNNLEALSDLLERVQGGEPLDMTALRVLVEDARSGSLRIRDTVRSLKAFSRFDPDHVHESISPDDLVQEALRICGNEVRHRATLALELNAAKLLTLDGSRLIQVLVNLLVNAAQAIEGDPSENEIRVSTWIVDGMANVEVSDTGAGIPEDVLPHIFDPFYTTKPQPEGTGLGLSISHRIVESLGGRLTVSTEKDSGSIFRISVPATPARTSGVHIASAEIPPDAQILVIDDEPQVGRALRRVLRKYNVIVTTSGDEALAWLELNPTPDAIICDLMMPGMTGMDLYDDVDAETQRRFLFLSGGAFTPGARAFVERVPQPVLDKPMEAQELRGAIADLVHSTQAVASGA